jgi:EmrB/QacA subfamily drug resistance transporter
VTQRFGHLITEENAKWWTLAAMCFALFMIMLDNTVMNVALPSIQSDLHASISSLEWVVNGYSLSFAVLLATGGRLGDILGRRRMFMTGVVLFAISSATAGLAPSTTALVASRVTQGIGASLMMPATLSIITNAFPPAERGRAIGTWAGVSALALALGPLLGGFLTEHVSWRAIFYLNIPVAAAAIAATLFAVRESRDETVGREIDWAGTAVLTVGLTAGVLALIEGNSWGWGSPRIIGLIAISIVVLAGFVKLEGRVRAPIVQFEFLRNRNFVGSLIVAFIISFSMLGMFFFMALYIQNILGYSPLEAGVRFLPTTLVIMFVAPIAGRLTDRIGPRPPIVAGLSLVAVSLFLQAQITDTSGYGSLLVPFILMGFGIALTMSPMSTAAMNAVHVTKSGLASGLLSMSRMVGGKFGVAVLGAIFQANSKTALESGLSGSGIDHSQIDSLAAQLGSGGLTQTIDHLPPDVAQQAAGAAHDAFISGLTNSIGVAAVVAAAGAVLAYFLIARKPGSTETEPAAEGAPRDDARAASGEPVPKLAGVGAD